MENDKSIPCVTWIGDSSTRLPWINKSFSSSPRIYLIAELGVMLQTAKQGLDIAQMPCALCEPDLCEPDPTLSGNNF